eukprot:Rhum_TRINITY_DN14643_c25_g1::Rhum_TRINITY_DN14643_c25_g1_i1::g.107503::m.107503
MLLVTRRNTGGGETEGVMVMVRGRWVRGRTRAQMHVFVCAVSPLPSHEKIGGSSDSLEHNADALSASDAGGADGVLHVALLQRVDKMRRDTSARSTQRVAHSNRTSVNVELLERNTQLPLHSNGLRGKRLVDLHEPDLVQRHVRGLQRLLRRRHGADAHDLRVAPGHAVRHQARQRRPALLCGVLLRRQDEGRRAVADAGRGAGVHDAVLLEDLGQLGEGGGGDVGAAVLVDGHLLHLAAHLKLDRHQLVRDATRLLRLAEQLLRPHRVLVHLLLRDLVLLRQVLRRQAHRHAGVAVGQALPQRVHELRLAELEAGALAGAVDRVRALAHVLRPAHQHHVRLAAQDLLRAQHHSLEARPAQTVHRQRRGGHRGAGLQADVPGKVDGVGRALAHVAEDDLVDARGVDVALRQGTLAGRHAEVRGAHALQAAGHGAERRALRRNDADSAKAHCVAGFFFLFHRSPMKYRYC